MDLPFETIGLSRVPGCALTRPLPTQQNKRSLKGYMHSSRLALTLKFWHQTLRRFTDTGMSIVEQEKWAKYNER